MALIHVNTPKNTLLRRAARLERQAAHHAVRAMACQVSPHFAAARVTHSVRFIELQKEAQSIRREAQRHARPRRQTAGWFHADWFGSPLTVTNVDPHTERGDVTVKMIVYVEGDPADFDTPELHKAMSYLVAEINADPDSPSWTHAVDLTLISFESTELVDGYCIHLTAIGEGPDGAPWDDRSMRENWLVLNYR